MKLTTKTAGRLSTLSCSLAIIACITPVAKAQALVGYYCNPATCYYVDTGSGIVFSNSMAIYGTFQLNQPPYTKTVKSTSKTITSFYCANATLTTYGETGTDPLFGDYIEADAEGAQNGIVEITGYTRRYFTRGASYTPPPSPCVG